MTYWIRIRQAFGTTNRSDWLRKRIFRLPRHEIENYLLDTVDLLNCYLHNRKRTEPQLLQMLHSQASKQPAWLAFRKVLIEIEKRIGHGQPSVPKMDDVTNIESALDRILLSNWFVEVPRNVQASFNRESIETELNTYHSQYQSMVASKLWKHHFSGKEIFRSIRDFLYQPFRKVSRNRNDHDADFAADLGMYQAANGRVPEDIRDLWRAIQTQISTTQ